MTLILHGAQIAMSDAADGQCEALGLECGSMVLVGLSGPQGLASMAGMCSWRALQPAPLLTVCSPCIAFKKAGACSHCLRRRHLLKVLERHAVALGTAFLSPFARLGVLFGRQADGCSLSVPTAADVCAVQLHALQTAPARPLQRCRTRRSQSLVPAAKGRVWLLECNRVLSKLDDHLHSKLLGQPWAMH